MKKESTQDPAKQNLARNDVIGDSADVFDPLSTVQGWVGALTLVSFLVAIGFISRISREEFLGTPPEQWDVSTLTLAAGRCFVESLLIPASFLSAHPYWTTVGVVALLSCATAIWTTRRHGHLFAFFRYMALMLVAIALAFVMRVYELPTIPLTNWLIYGPPELPCNLHTPGQPKRQGVQLIVGCANRTAQELVASKLDYDYDNSKPGVLYQFDLTPAQARAAITRHYAVAVMVCLLGWLWFLYALALGKAAKDTFFSLANAVFFLGLALATAFVPYMYGKLIQGTAFPEAEVSYRETAADSKQETTISDDFAVVSRSDKSISLLSAKPAVFRIVEVPLERVIYIHFYGTVDPFAINLRTKIPAKN